MTDGRTVAPTLNWVSCDQVHARLNIADLHRAIAQPHTDRYPSFRGIDYTFVNSYLSPAF
jgi:hypothetical protein